MNSVSKALLLAALVVVTTTPASAVSIIPNSTPIPDSEVLLFGGLEWVYAGPVGTDDWGPGIIEAPSYRVAEGWRFATAGEWANRPDWTDFIKAGYTVADVPALSGWTDHTKYRFTSEYWSDFTWVDLSDAAGGYLTNGREIPPAHYNYETWYVRDAVGAPDAGTTASLLGLAFVAVGAVRRKLS